MAEGLDRLRIKDRPDRSAASGLRPPRRRWSRWALGLALLAAAAFGYFRIQDSRLDVETVAVALSYPAQSATLFNATGYVVAQTKADVASKATGRLESLDVREGMAVTQGQVLARVENRDLQAAMNQAAANIDVAIASLHKAEAEWRTAERVLARARALLARHFISQEAFDAELARNDQARAAVEGFKAEIVAARAAYESAKVQYDYTLIRAPFDGVVLKKSADIGDVLAPFSTASLSKGAVVSMADLSTLEVEADVSESSLIQVKLDQPCEIQLDALPDVRLRGIVKSIVPTVDRAKATVLVKVGFVDRDERILPDMSAKVSFLSRPMGEQERLPVLTLPPAAVTERGGGPIVFRLDGDRIRMASVTTAGKLGDRVVIARGLAAGDRVVLMPPVSLRDGDRVREVAPK